MTTPGVAGIFSAGPSSCYKITVWHYARRPFVHDSERHAAMQTTTSKTVAFYLVPSGNFGKLHGVSALMLMDK